jgi:hypothetical protein
MHANAVPFECRLAGRRGNHRDDCEYRFSIMVDRFVREIKSALASAFR